MIKELIEIQTNEEGERLVSARLLHDKLGVKTRFTDWIKRRLLKYRFAQENTNYTVVMFASQNWEANKSGNFRGGHNQVDYIITLELAKHICMMEDTEKGIEVRNYFIECERELIQGRIEYFKKAEENSTIEFNPRLRTIQERITKIKNLEGQIRETQKRVQLEYSLISFGASRMYEIIGIENTKSILTAKEYSKG